MLPQLSQCCCGCSLQTGAILIGAYQLVRGLFEVGSEILVELTTSNHVQGWRELWNGVPFVEIVLGVLKIISALVLIFGANKERYRLIFWWLIVNVSLLIIEGALFPLNVAVFFMYSTTAEAVITLLLGLADIALELSFLWVVYSYYRIVEERAPASPVASA